MGNLTPTGQERREGRKGWRGRRGRKGGRGRKADARIEPGPSIPSTDGCIEECAAVR